MDMDALTYRHYTNTYFDTRGFVACGKGPSFTETIIKGIAPGGGLFVPQVLPRFTLKELAALVDCSYPQLAAYVFKRFGVDLPDETIDSLMQTAYGDNFDDPAITPVRTLAPGKHVLELWHGPTSAFKDMALQCLPVFFSAAIEQQRLEQGSGPTEDFLILVATSGDTGKAALEGFTDRAHTGVIVFYPHGGVSDIQFKQMATQLGDNVGVFGVRGNFDDCQTAVKGAFSDETFNAELAATHRLRLSSANSINWGRLLPQVVYYMSAYLQLIARDEIACGDKIDVCVPTGNFGNILAAWYAKEIGVPIEQLICASNDNRVLTDFINTGTYDITERPFILTPSPSMDILVSSNLERQLFELCGRNSALIQDWMDKLRTERRFTVDRETFAALRSHFSADWVSADESLTTIHEVFKAYQYLIDPHTAVAWKAAERLRGVNPVIIVSTAHWAKFGANVFRALSRIPAGKPLPDWFGTLTDVRLNAHVSAIWGAAPPPPRLSSLDAAPIRFAEVIDGTIEAVEQAALQTLANWHSPV